MWPIRHVSQPNNSPYAVWQAHTESTDFNRTQPVNVSCSLFKTKKVGYFVGSAFSRRAWELRRDCILLQIKVHDGCVEVFRAGFERFLRAHNWFRWTIFWAKTWIFCGIGIQQASVGVSRNKIMSHSEVSLCVCRSCLELSRIGWSLLVKLIVTRWRVSKKICLRRKASGGRCAGHHTGMWLWTQKCC